MEKYFIRMFLLLFFLSVVRWGAADSQADMQKRMAQVRIIFPSAHKLVFPIEEKDWIDVKDEGGVLLGRIALTSPFADHIKGYAGPVPLLIGVDPDMKIAGIVLLENSETSAFIKRLQKPGGLADCKGVYWKDIIDNKMDAVTGATMTSSAFISTLKFRLNILDSMEK